MHTIKTAQEYTYEKHSLTTNLVGAGLLQNRSEIKVNIQDKNDRRNGKKRTLGASIPNSSRISARRKKCVCTTPPPSPKEKKAHTPTSVSLLVSHNTTHRFRRGAPKQAMHLKIHHKKLTYRAKDRFFKTRLRILDMSWNRLHQRTEHVAVEAHESTEKNIQSENKKQK